MHLNYKRHLRDDTFSYITIKDTAGYTVETFKDKTMMSAYIIKKALIPIGWDCIFQDQERIVLIVYVV